MQPINTAADLKNAIRELEQKQAAEWSLLKEGLLDTYESLKLVNMIKRTFKEVATVPDLKTNIINATIGLTTGIVTKKLLIGKTINPLKKLLGIILEVAVAGKVTKNADGIKTIGSQILKRIFNKRNHVEKT